MDRWVRGMDGYIENNYFQLRSFSSVFLHDVHWLDEKMLKFDYRPN